jgi:hypothetical protein
MAKRKRSTLERRQQGQKLNRRERQEIERRFQREDPGWDIVHKNGAGLDVGNASHFVAIDPKLDSRPVREFGSWTAALREMADWLKGLGIQRVVPIWGPAIVPYGDDSDVGSRRGRRWHVIWPVLSTACLPRVRLGSIAALPTSNKNDKNARFITCNAERPPSECNWLLQTRLRR